MNGLKQSFWLPTPTLTEKNLEDQAGRVFIVTGGYGGVGYELSKMLYSKNGTVYLAGRSESKAQSAIADFQSAYPDSKGKLAFLSVDLSDLTTIKPAAEKFMSLESRLDVLTNNAGVMVPPRGSETVQGHELQIGTNCLGPYLFSECLVPILSKTAASSPAGSVRVTWAGSLAIDLGSPKGGLDFIDPSKGEPRTKDNPGKDYGQSKAGNLFLATEFTKRHPYAESKIISQCWNPGNLKSGLQRHIPSIGAVLMGPILFHPRFGAYTELWAGWSEEAGLAENNGKFVWPWGRFGGYRPDIQASIDNGNAANFWDWCDEETKAYR